MPANNTRIEPAVTSNQLVNENNTCVIIDVKINKKAYVLRLLGLGMI